MSKRHFLVDKLQNDSILHSRQHWRYLIQRILNNEFSNELKILQIEFDSNIFQRYQYQLINEYKIQENERIYKILKHSLLSLPTREIIISILIQVESILQYPIINSHRSSIKIVPFIVQYDIIMKLSEIKYPIKQELTQKGDTSKAIKTSFIKDNSLILILPIYCSIINEQYIFCRNSHTQISLLSNQYSSDDLRQMIIQTIHRNSYQDEFLSSLNNLFFRKRHQNSLTDISNDNNLSRLSLRSISYSFNHKAKLDEKNSQHKNIHSTLNYHLPANKIELDINQQEIIRRSGAFKRKSDII